MPVPVTVVGRLTGDAAVACAKVTEQVSSNPDLYLRSLRGWGEAGPDLTVDDICRLPS